MHLKPEYAIDEGDLESVSFDISSSRLSLEEVGFGTKDFEPTPPLYEDVMGTEPPPLGPPMGCCRLTITDVVIEGTLHICDTDVVFPSHTPMSCVAVSDDAGGCPSCNGLSCNGSTTITDNDHLCPDGANMTGSLGFTAAIQCLGDGFGWSVHVNAFGSVVCPCVPSPHILGFDNTWEQIVADPEDLPGTYPVSGDFTDSGSPDLTWSGTLVIERTEACRCPCRYMSFDCTMTYTNCFGTLSGLIHFTGLIDWETTFCCQNPLNEACFSSDPDVNGAVASFCVNRTNGCYPDESPWQILTSNVFGICGFGTSVDIEDPPGTYEFDDEEGGHLHWVITLDCSDTPP